MLRGLQITVDELSLLLVWFPAALELEESAGVVREVKLVDEFEDSGEGGTCDEAEAEADTA